MSALSVSVLLALAGLVLAAAVAGLVLQVRTRRQLAALQRAVAPLPATLAELSARTEALTHAQAEAQAGAEDTAQVTAAVTAARRATEVVRKRVDRVERGQQRVVRDQVREVEALLQLYDGLPRRDAMPACGNWALNPTDLLELWTLLDQLRPKQVLELGSGTSSVWLGYALERFGGRLVSVDHEPQFAAATQQQLQRHGLTEVAEVREAPLRPVLLDDTVAGGPVASEGVAGEFPWYAPEVVADLVNVDVVLVDGPPGKTRRHARLPALPMLRERLAPTATVVLDDTNRADEEEIVQQWLAAYPEAVRQPTMRGKLAVLTLDPAAPERRTV